jgi:hypothetical protein
MQEKTHSFKGHKEHQEPKATDIPTRSYIQVLSGSCCVESLEEIAFGRVCVLAGTANRKREEGCILGGRWTKKEALSGFGRVYCGRGRIPLIQSLQPCLTLGVREVYVCGASLLLDCMNDLPGKLYPSLLRFSCRLIYIASWLTVLV